MNRYIIGVVLVVLSAVGFGFMTIFALFAYQRGVSVPTLLFLRFLIACLIFFTFLILRFRTWKISRSEFLWLFLLGGILYTMQSSLYFSSVKYISPSLAALLLYMYPLFVAILAVFIEGQKITWKIAVSIVLSLIGMSIVLGTPFGSINFFGASLALGAGLTYSVYIIIGNRVVSKIPPLVMSAYVALFASLSFMVFGFTTNSISLPTDRISWLAIFGVALLSTVLAISTFFAGMKIIGSTQASILSTIEPVVTAVLSFLLFQERLTWLQLLGGAIVLVSASLVVLFQQSSRLPQSINLQESTLPLQSAPNTNDQT